MAHQAQFLAFGDDDDVDMGRLIRVENTPIIYRSKPRKVLKQKYIVGQVLGEGSYARVKECVDIETQRRCAVKIVALRHVRKKIPGGLANVDREVSTLQILNHKNIVKLLDDFTLPEREKRYIILEYCVGSLHDLQAKGLPLDSDAFRRLPETQACDYFKQLLIGVEYLHKMKVIHKDLKPGNLLLTADEVVKITDFGTCERLAPSSSSDMIRSSQATPAIQPPEVARGELESFSGFKLDVYCCGICLFFMLAGRVPYRDANVLRIYERICSGEYSMPTDISPQVQELIRLMLSMDPDVRPSLHEVQKHEWCIDSNVHINSQKKLCVDEVFRIIDDAQAVKEAEEALLGGGATEESTELGLDYTAEDIVTSTPMHPRNVRVGMEPLPFDLTLDNGSVEMNPNNDLPRSQTNTNANDGSPVFTASSKKSKDGKKGCQLM